MGLPTPGDDAPSGVCCPTCHAEQEWSDTCRRCKCDLTLGEQKGTSLIFETWNNQ